MTHTHCTGPGQVKGPGNDGSDLSILPFVLYILHRDRDRDRGRELLFSIVPILVSVPVLDPVPCSVYVP